jgi:hypothetical protein
MNVVRVFWKKRLYSSAFWNNDILGNIDGVMVRIMEASQALTPTLSLKGEEAEKEV